MIKYIREINNVEINALNKRSDYESHSKIIKSMLTKKGEHLKLTKIIKENVDIIN